MTADTIAEHLNQSLERFFSESRSNAKWEVLREGLLTWIQRIPPEEGFAGLIYAIEAYDGYQVQWIAGDLLLRAGIPCDLTAAEWLNRVITKLNLSADTVVLYGVSVFGRQGLADAVKAALAEDRASGLRKKRLEMMIYCMTAKS